jgi:hypothetical protein
VGFIARFLAFWYDFIVGDDWTVAAAVVVGLVIAALLAPSHVPLWWWMPLVVAAILTFSLTRASRAS